jgi:hypothetical protein
VLAPHTATFSTRVRSKPSFSIFKAACSLSGNQIRIATKYELKFSNTMRTTMHSVAILMSKPTWACSVCGEDFTRRSSAERHRDNVHQGNSLVIRFVDYLAGRASGIYPTPIDPPRLLRTTRPQFGKTPNDHLVRAIPDNSIKDFGWYTNMNTNLSRMDPSFFQHLSNQSSNQMPSPLDEFFTNLQKMLQLKTIMNHISNQEIPYLVPTMNVSRPLCSTGILPYANISTYKVRTGFDHYFDTIIKINMLKNLL